MYVIMAKCVLSRMPQNKYFAGLILRLKPGFDVTFSSCGKKNVEMCIGGFVFMVAEFSVICPVVFA